MATRNTDTDPSSSSSSHNNVIPFSWDSSPPLWVLTTDGQAESAHRSEVAVYWFR